MHTHALHTVTLLDNQQLKPRLHRLTFTTDAFADFPLTGPDEYFGLVMPKPGRDFEPFDIDGVNIRAAVAAEDFPAAMTAIAALRAPVDAFFEAVQVNSDNPILRRNRLNLLSRIREAGRLVADFGRIEG